MQWGSDWALLSCCGCWWICPGWSCIATGYVSIDWTVISGRVINCTGALALPIGSAAGVGDTYRYWRQSLSPAGWHKMCNGCCWKQNRFEDGEQSWTSAAEFTDSPERQLDNCSYAKNWHKITNIHQIWPFIEHCSNRKSIRCMLAHYNLIYLYGWVSARYISFLECILHLNLWGLCGMNFWISVWFWFWKK